MVQNNGKTIKDVLFNKVATDYMRLIDSNLNCIKLIIHFLCSTNYISPVQ